MDDQQNIIIYRTADGRASVALYAKDGKIWLNQQQMAQLFATSKPNISMHIANILKEKELNEISVVKNFLTTAADGKNYNVVFYSLEMPTTSSPSRTRTSFKAMAPSLTRRQKPSSAKSTTPSMPSANSLMHRPPMPKT